ncbi:MAG: hypothetical protein MZV70_14405 [Desulfobacterales bacterium]|nr:hypothetical protein [Desulfobacterales bacterium]
MGAYRSLLYYKDEKINVVGYGIEALFHILPDGALRSLLSLSVSAASTIIEYNQDTTEGKDNKTSR